jgi:hypothetical protein
MITILKQLFRTIDHDSFKEYKFKYIKGIIGFIEGLYRYTKNKRYENNTPLMVYCIYFIVKKITGKEPEGDY